MHPDIHQEPVALQRMTVRALRDRYTELFGEATRTGNKTWLMRRIAWRLQAVAEGDLSERARQRAVELANEADLRISAPRTIKSTQPLVKDEQPGKARFHVNRRLPPPGTLLLRPYKGRTLQVRVLADGFAYDGQVYRSLSAVAKAITGSHCSGHLFFRLTAQGVAS